MEPATQRQPFAPRHEHGPRLRSSSPPPAPLDDGELLARVAGGDPAALGDLYDRFAPRLLACAQRILGRRADAEEVLQEVFLQVWGMAGRYDAERASVPTWLALLTRSRSLDRKRGVRSFERLRQGSRREQLVRVPVEAPEGGSRVLRRERRLRLRRALAGLPAEQRQVLDLAYYAGLTQSEISRRLGVPLGTVKTRTVLGMRKLRSTLASELDELL